MRFSTGSSLGSVAPKDRIEILSFEGTTAAAIAERIPGVLGLADRVRVMGSLALSLCHLADGRVDAVCSLKEARSVDIAAAQLLVRECGLAIELFEDPPLRRRRRSISSRARALPRPRRPSSWPRSPPHCARYARSMRPDRDAILKALEQVIDPEIRKPVTELDMVRDVLSTTTAPSR